MDGDTSKDSGQPATEKVGDRHTAGRLWLGGSKFCAGMRCQYMLPPIFTNDTAKVTNPTPIDLPGPVVKIANVGFRIYVQLTDGAWVGRGGYIKKHGISGVPVFACSPPTGRHLIRWTPVTDEFAAVLDARDSHVMSFARPISNV